MSNDTTEPIIVDGNAYKKVPALINGTCQGCAGSKLFGPCFALPNCEDSSIIFVEVANAK